MKDLKRKKVDGLWVYDIPDAVCAKLFKERDSVLGNTYPKPNKVTTALLTKTGNIYKGVNYYAQVYTLTMHAEMVALGHAATHGEKEVIAITGPNCHICKQLIWESAVRSKIDPIIILEEEGGIKKIPLSTMMMYPWPARDGTK